jgi:hypothetical protein
MSRSVPIVHRAVAITCIGFLIGCDRPESAKPAASQNTSAPRAKPAASQNTPAPRFEDFPAGTFTGKPAPVDLTSDPDAPQFRTRLREGAKGGPNFAGHLTVITWGCGTQCQVYALVDARSGRVYSDTLLDFSCHDPEFRLNSTLVIQRPDTLPGGSCSDTRTRFFKWTGERFVDITVPGR